MIGDATALLEGVRTIAVVFLAAVGSLFALVAAVGVLRMPDVYTRAQASGKAATLGAACILAAVALQSGSAAVAVRGLLIVAFICVTGPVAAHVIARAAYLTGVPLSDDTRLDELADANRGHTGRSEGNGR